MAGIFAGERGNFHITDFRESCQAMVECNICPASNTFRQFFSSNISHSITLLPYCFLYITYIHRVFSIKYIIVEIFGDIKIEMTSLLVLDYSLFRFIYVTPVFIKLYVICIIYAYLLF